MNLSTDILQKMKAYPPFAQKVWRGCAAIPKGETWTYGQLARKIGHPKAARAVGQALSKNPFAPTVPCHRVIAANGDLRGYSARGGLSTKARLLKEEGVSLKKPQ